MYAVYAIVVHVGPSIHAAGNLGEYISLFYNVYIVYNAYIVYNGYVRCNTLEESIFCQLLSIPAHSWDFMDQNKVNVPWLPLFPVRV